MILVCGGLADTITELVCARLLDCGYPFRFLDLGTFPAGFEVSWQWQRDRLSGYIAGPGWRLNLDDIGAVYVRFPTPDARVPPRIAHPELAPAAYAECDAGLTALFEHLPCPVVNRLDGSMSNHSKPFQALLIRRCGLRTPPTS